MRKKISEVPSIAARAACQRSVPSDNILLDTPCVEGVMFNTKCTNLNIFDVMWDFLIYRVGQNVLKT